MSAAMQTSGLPQQDRPIPERNTYVPGWYLEQPHEDMETVVYELIDGDKVPLVSYGTTVRIGMVPPERRWAIALDGQLLDRRMFNELHERVFTGYFDLINRMDPNAQAESGDPNLRYVPDPRAFVSECVNDRGTGYAPIGYDPHKPPAPKIRRQSTEDVIDPEELAAAGYVQVETDTGDADKIAALEAQIAKLMERMDKPEPTEAAPKRKTIKAPCGKELGGGLTMHMKNCDKCQEPSLSQSAEV